MSMFDDFESITESMGELPPSPIVATKLLELLRKPDLKIKELANAVSLDPVISARLMKMANSVFYQQMKQISTVDRAIIVVVIRWNIMKSWARVKVLKLNDYGLSEILAPKYAA